MTPEMRPSIGFRQVWRRVRHSATLWPLTALIVLLLFNILTTPGFAQLEIRDGRVFGTLVDIFQNGAPVMLMAIGMTLVIAVEGIDLSVGSVMALSGATAALLMTESGTPVPLAVAAALGLAIAVGVWNGVLVTYVGLQPIIATLIMLVAGRGVAQVLTDDQKVPFEIPSFEFIANGTLFGLPVPIYIIAAVALAALIALRKTVAGLYIEAIGSNALAAGLCGLPVHTVRLLAFGFCGLCAGAAGLIATADIKEADVANCGLYLELDTILAVVIGGTSLSGGRPHLLGSLIGAVIMQTLTVMLQSRGVITEHTLIIKALVVVLVCFMQTDVFAKVFGRVAGRRSVGCA